VSKLRRLIKLERRRPDAPQRGLRTFATLGDGLFLEVTHCVFDPSTSMDIFGGEWPAFVRDRLITREALEAIRREGWQISIVHWTPLGDEAEDAHA